MNIKGFKDANGNVQKYDINALATSFTAEVGQVLVVESVDKNGHPNGFSVVDQPNGVEITSSSPTKEGTVLTINPSSEKINLYTAEETDEKLRDLGTVEITDGEPVKENTVMTFNPNAEDLNLYSAEETDEKFAALGGTVEITNGDPTKESTLLTVNPDAEEKLVYEAGEVDEIAVNLENQIKEIGGVEVTSGEPSKENTVLIIDPNEEEVTWYDKDEVDAIVSELRENQSFDILVSNADFKKGYKLSKEGEEEIKEEGGVTGYIPVAGTSKIKITYSTLDITKGTSVVEYDNDDNFVTRSTIWTDLAEEPIIKDYEFIILLNPNTKRIRISLNELSDVFCNITFYNLPINRYCYSRDDIDVMFGSYATDIANLIGGIE